MPNIILYLAASADGFIADVNGSVDWLPQPKNDEELEKCGYNQLMADIDTILMGSKSFEQILGFGDWPWPQKQTYVFSSRNLHISLPCVHLTHDSPRRFMQKHPSGKAIWLLGGAALASSFAQEHLIDEIILTVIPQTLGQGIALNVSLDNFHLKAEKPLTEGMVQRIYVKNRCAG